MKKKKVTIAILSIITIISLFASILSINAETTNQTVIREFIIEEGTVLNLASGDKELNGIFTYSVGNFEREEITTKIITKKSYTNEINGLYVIDSNGDELQLSNSIDGAYQRIKITIYTTTGTLTLLTTTLLSSNVTYTEKTLDTFNTKIQEIVKDNQTTPVLKEYIAEPGDMLNYNQDKACEVISGLFSYMDGDATQEQFYYGMMTIYGSGDEEQDGLYLLDYDGTQTQIADDYTGVLDYINLKVWFVDIDQADGIFNCLGSFPQIEDIESWEIDSVIWSYNYRYRLEYFDEGYEYGYADGSVQEQSAIVNYYTELLKERDKKIEEANLLADKKTENANKLKKEKEDLEERLENRIEYIEQQRSQIAYLNQTISSKKSMFGGFMGDILTSLFNGYNNIADNVSLFGITITEAVSTLVVLLLLIFIVKMVKG